MSVPLVVWWGFLSVQMVEAMTENPRINILINLSSRLLCEGLQLLMEQDSATYRTVIAHDPESVRGFVPHKILFDATTLKYPFPVLWHDAKMVLIDTGLGEEEVISLLFQHRLDGVISIGTDSELFRKALKTIRSGQIWIDNSKLRGMLRNPPSLENIPAQESYSRREREIVLLIVKGQTNREIVSQLNLSENTVKSHLSRIFSKTGVTSRVQLTTLAIRFEMEAVTTHHG
jgi:LuxR family transcriptional regulator, positive regulator of biofilm formation